MLRCFTFQSIISMPLEANNYWNNLMIHLIWLKDYASKNISRYTTMDEIVFIRRMDYLTIWLATKNSYFCYYDAYKLQQDISKRKRLSTPFLLQTNTKDHLYTTYQKFHQEAYRLLFQPNRDMCFGSRIHGNGSISIWTPWSRIPNGARSK